MRIKRMFVLLLALMMTCTVFSCALADDDVTIPKGKPAKAGSTLTKAVLPRPRYWISTKSHLVRPLNSGFTVMDHAQVSPTFVLAVGNVCPSDITIAGIWLKTKSIIVFGGRQHKRLMVQPTFTLPLFRNT